MTEGVLDELVKILRDRDVPYDRDVLRSVLNDPEGQTAIREWMDEYLTPETLLTKDEASLYTTLIKSGEAERLAAQDLSAVQPLNDVEIRAAIEELKRSTAAIEKQSEALRQQQNALSVLVKSDQRASQSRSYTSKAQLKKWNLEKNLVGKAIDELSQSLTYQISDLEQQSKAFETTVKQTVDTILKSDDKLLASLQKLASDLDPIQPNDDETMARIRGLSARLIKHTVEGIRTRLDRIYLEALHGSSETNEKDQGSQEMQDLQEELESLYSEILPVAQMSAEQQFLQPALKDVAANNWQGQERAMKAVKYIHQCLVFLVTRMETFLERAEESQCHQMALQSVLYSAKEELTRIEETSTTKPVSTLSDIQRRKSSVAKTPTARGKGTCRRSSGVENDDIDPEQQISQTLGINLPLDGVPDQARADALERALSDRLTKLSIHISSLESTTESSISTHILDSKLTLQLLQDSLLAETFYHNVRLLDPDIEASVSMFEHEIEDLKGALEGADLGRLQARDLHREEIIRRWVLR